MNKKINIGIIGVGHMGQYHVNVSKQLQDAELVGIYDADLDRSKLISEKYKTKAFNLISNLLNEVDGVIIASPTYLHHEISKQALEAGKHVLVEKPIAESVEQAKELVALAKSKNLILQVGHVERFNGAILELGKIVDQPMLVESRRLAPFNTRIRDVGVVLDMMIHDIDIILNLVKSDVTEISAAGQKVVSDHEDIASVVLKFANGCIATINASRNTQSKIRTLNITDKNAYIKLDFTDQEIELHRQATSNTQLSTNEIRYKQESIVEKIFVHKDNPLKQEHEHFINCILGNTVPHVDGNTDIKTLEIAHTILDKISRGKCMTEESGPSYRGSILISNSTIISDDFNKTVVFMIEHDSSGAFGLVINKKSEYSLHEVVVGVPENVAEEVPMYWGGPVDHSFISILHNQSSFKDPGLEVIPGVYLSRSYELLISLLENSESRFKVFHGYSGWGKMQLESEFERKSWVEHKVNDKFILYRDTEEAWREALKSKGGIYKYFAEHTNDPLLN